MLQTDSRGELDQQLLRIRTESLTMPCEVWLCLFIADGQVTRRVVLLTRARLDY